MLKVHFNERPGEGFGALDAGKRSGRRKSSAPLGEWFAIPAMKFGSAPLPAFRGLEKALLCRGLADDPLNLVILLAGILSMETQVHGEAGMLMAESPKTTNSHREFFGIIRAANHRKANSIGNRG